MQFRPGMSWENYGEWHIDHRVPIAAFKFSSPLDPGFRACWRLTNLRPLWRVDNQIKSAKCTPGYAEALTILARIPRTPGDVSMTDKPEAPSKTYKDHTITFDPESFNFKIAGPLITTGGWSATAESLAAAEKHIDGLLRNEVQTKKEKLHLEVYLPDGSPGVVTGVHAGHGRLTGVPDVNDVYPRVPWIAAMLAEQRELQKKLGDIRTALHEVHIRAKASYGAVEPGAHPRYIARLKQEYEAATKKAQREQERIDAHQGQAETQDG